METNSQLTTVETPGELVTAEHINIALGNVLEAMDVLAFASKDVIEKCWKAGATIKAKRSQFPKSKPKEGEQSWVEWLAANCPDLSDDMAGYFIKTHDIVEELKANGQPLPDLPARIHGARRVFELSKEHQQRLAGESEAQADKKDEKPKTSRLIKWLFDWGKILSKKPAEKWDKEERREFLADLDQRLDIAKQQGWIDVEAEVTTEGGN